MPMINQMNATFQKGKQSSVEHFSVPLTTPVNPTVCPLSGSPQVEVLEEFPTSWLVTGYQRDLGIDVSHEFRGVENLQLCWSPSSHLIFFHPGVTGSSTFYQSLQRFTWYYPAQKFEYQRAASWIKPGDRVLDIGCGAKQFAAYLPDASYHGFEPNQVSGTPSRSPRIQLSSGDTPGPDRRHSPSYDVVCAFQVLEHVADPHTFLSEALASLKPDGILIIGVPSADSYITRIPNLVLNAPPHHLTWWTDEALVQMAEQFALNILELAHAPVEAWETRLYWMQRLSNPLLPRTSSHFSKSYMLRLVNIATYVGAGFLQHLTTPPGTAHGATTLMVARKTGMATC